MPDEDASFKNCHNEKFYLIFLDFFCRLCFSPGCFVLIIIITAVCICNAVFHKSYEENQQCTQKISHQTNIKQYTMESI